MRLTQRLDKASESASVVGAARDCVPLWLTEQSEFRAGRRKRPAEAN